MKKTPFWLKYFIFYSIAIIAVVVVMVSVILAGSYSERRKVVNSNVDNIIYFSDTALSDKLKNIEEHFGGTEIAQSFKNAALSKSNTAFETQKLIESLCADYNDVLAIFYVDKEGNNYSAGVHIGGLSERLSLMKKAASAKDYQKRKSLWFFARTDSMDNVSVNYREIVHINDAFVKDYLGRILIYVDSDKLNYGNFSGMGDGTGTVFTDIYGKIVIASDKTIIGKPFNEVFDESDEYISSNGVNYLYKKSKSKINGWTNYAYYDSALIGNQIWEAYSIAFILVLIIITSILVLLYFITKRMGKPIEELFSHIRVTSAGDLQVETNDEFHETQEIRDIFDNLTAKLKNQININYQNEILIKNSMIKAYESQMNPHFLYNTLQIIQMLNVIDKKDEVTNLTNYLGNMLRFNLDKSSEVTIGEELENITNYFKILKLRYGDKFSYEIMVDESLYDCRTVKFLLQPFVENAVNHGLKDKEGLWKIVIAATEIHGEIAFVIRDNGAGIPKGKLEEIKRGLAYGKNSSVGIGISNVNERIKLAYGNKYGVDIFCTGTTQVVIHIPKLRGED